MQRTVVSILFIIVCLSIVAVCSSADDDDKFTSTRTTKHSPAATQSPSPTQQSNVKKNEEKEDIYERKRNKLHTELENYRQQLVNFHTLEKEYAKQNQNLEKYYQQAIKLVETGEFKEAIHHLQQAAQKNHAKSLFELGRIYENGKGVEIDFTKAFEYFKRAANLGDEQAQRSIAFLLDTGKGTSIDKAQALLYYTFAAEALDIEASHVLGYKYSKGYEVVKNCSLAAKYLRRVAFNAVEETKKHYFDYSPYRYVDKLEDYVKDGDLASSQEEIINLVIFSALNGDPNSMVEVGFIYMNGIYNYEVDYEKARLYLEEAANIHSNPKAMAFLGYMYEKGLGSPPNLNRAIDLYQKSADLNSPFGINFLGEVYLHGKGKTAQNFDKALSLFKRAASSSAQAAVNLGKMYFYGKGVPVNYESAVQNFKIAANGDNAEGLYYLAVSLHYGLGVLEDCNTAVELYKKAAQHGDLKLDYQVALSYIEEGDYDRALLIYEKLAERGQEVGQSNAAWIYDANLQSSKFGNHEKDINSVFALKYYRRSADQGNSISHLKLGDYYYFGKGGLSVDYAKAVHYYTYISGVNAQAKFNLGYMHHHGEGMTKDLFLAKRFYDDSLLANPNSYIPVKLSLLFLGLDYAADQIQKGNYFLLLEQARDYFVPEVIFTGFTDPKVASSSTNEKNPATSTAGKSEKGNNAASLEPSIWDTETLFGYNFDTVVIFTLGIVLFVSLLIRYQIIQFQV